MFRNIDRAKTETPPNRQADRLTISRARRALSKDIYYDFGLPPSSSQAAVGWHTTFRHIRHHPAHAGRLRRLLSQSENMVEATTRFSIETVVAAAPFAIERRCCDLRRRHQSVKPMRMRY